MRESDEQREKRHDPRGAIEAGRGRRSQYRGPVFLYEGLLDKAVAVSTSDGGHEFVAHAVGIRAADVVAFKQNLSAAADAHQLVAELVETSAGIAGAGEDRDHSGEDRAVQPAAKSRIEF